MTLSEELSWRGFANQTTYKDNSNLDNHKVTFYWGVDPSASSMTIGNLAAAMMVGHFMKHGHRAVLLVGGATGMIGDPDGKSQERNLLSLKDIQRNKAAIAAQYRRLFSGKKFDIVDNYDWFKEVGYLEFLRDVGKHVPMSQLLQRDFVQTRLGEGGAGISYGEFSYALIQGYDFLHLFRKKNVSLQLCGSDQWANSLAGVELIRRLENAEAHVWSAPLVVNKTTGKKFGKTEEGAIWLDESLTSVYKFYQFWFNVDDKGVEDYLKIYTQLNKEQIEAIMHDFKHEPASRLAQKILAYEATKLVHGHKRADSVRRLSEALFGGSEYKHLNKEDFKLLESELTVVNAKSDKTSLLDILTESGLAASKSEARRFLEDSAVYINGLQFSSEKTCIEKSDSIKGYALIRRGKNNQALVKLR